MTKEELKQEAKEYVCKRNPLVVKEWFIDALKKYDKGEKVKYLRDCEIAEYEAYIAGAESREKQIDELKAQIKVLGQNLEDSEIIIAGLEAQIEKMKCCFNCKHSRTEYEHCKTDKHEKWEIKENDVC